MDNQITFMEALPYIQAWCGCGIAFCLIFLVYHRNFCKKHPEISTINCTPEIRRKYNNLVMGIFTGFFVWIIGMVALIEYLSGELSLRYFIPVCLMLLLPLSNIKPK